MSRAVDLHVVDMEEVGAIDEDASEDDEEDDRDDNGDAGDIAQVLPALTLGALLGTDIAGTPALVEGLPLGLVGLLLGVLG